MGVAAVRLATALGGEVIAAVASEAKFGPATAAGAKHVCTYDQLRAKVSEVTNEGVDVAYDVVRCGQPLLGWVRLQWSSCHTMV